MYQQARVQDLSRDKVLRFNELLRSLKHGKIPAALVNPVLIQQHNEFSPSVAQITHPNDEVSLDMLLLQYASDGVSTRRSFRDAVRTLNNNDEVTVKQSVALSRRERHLHMMENMNDRS